MLLLIAYELTECCAVCLWSMYILQYSIIGNEDKLIDSSNGKLKLLVVSYMYIL